MFQPFLVLCNALIKAYTRCRPYGPGALDDRVEGLSLPLGIHGPTLYQLRLPRKVIIELSVRETTCTLVIERTANADIYIYIEDEKYLKLCTRRPREKEVKKIELKKTSPVSPNARALTTYVRDLGEIA